MEIDATTGRKLLDEAVADALRHLAEHYDPDIDGDDHDEAIRAAIADVIGPPEDDTWDRLDAQITILPTLDKVDASAIVDPVQVGRAVRRGNLRLALVAVALDAAGRWTEDPATKPTDPICPERYAVIVLTDDRIGGQSAPEWQIVASYLCNVRGGLESTAGTLAYFDEMIENEGLS